MLILNQMPLLKTLGYKHLNTLYVDIKRHICYFNLNWIINLNTLYVDIKHSCTILIESELCHLNTLYVDIKHCVWPQVPIWK